MKIHIKGDERILGDSDFVEKVLSQASEQMERRYRLKAKGWTLTKVTERVAVIFGIEKDQVVVAGKQPDRVCARSVLAYWAIRDLGLTATEVGKYLGRLFDQAFVLSKLPQACYALCGLKSPVTKINM